MTTLSQHEFLRTSPENFLRGRPGVVRIRGARANRTTDRTPGKTTHIDRDMVWLVAVSAAGIIVSVLLGAAFPLLDVGATMDAPAATITATRSAQPTFHEQFNLRPTEGDVQEQVATF
jgi:hypothetical protein